MHEEQAGIYYQCWYTQDQGARNSKQKECLQTPFLFKTLPGISYFSSPQIIQANTLMPNKMEFWLCFLET